MKNFFPFQRTRLTRQKPFPFQYQALEARQLLAGNVAASLNNQVLSLVGDDQANRFSVFESGLNEVTVRGIDTTINGQSSVSFTRPINSLRIDLGSGANELTIETITISRTISVVGGNNSDRVVMAGVRATDVDLFLGGGNNVMELNGVNIRKNISVVTGDGNDVVSIDAMNVGRRFFVSTGGGNDSFASNYLNVTRSFTVDLGQGDNSLLFAGETSFSRRSRATIVTGDGNDLIVIAPSQKNEIANMRRLTVNLGAGDDTLLFAGTVNLKRGNFNGGDGNNTINNAPLAGTRVAGFANTSPVDIEQSIGAVLERLNLAEVDTEAIFNSQPSEMTFSVAAIPNQQLDFAEAFRFTATTDTPSIPVTWSISETGIPNNVAHNQPSISSLGLINWTPSSSDNVALTVTATAANGQTASTTFNVAVSPFVPWIGEKTLALIPTQVRSQIYQAAGIPPLLLNANATYEADFNTTDGEFTVRLFADQTPITVNNFVALARDGFYDGLDFHRVLENFVAQGGDPLGTGSGGPGYTFADEFVADLEFSRPRLLAMANNGPATNGSQFFITYGTPDFLNNRHTIFGEIIGDATAFEQITLTATSDPIVGEVPIPGAVKTVIESITIRELV